MIDKEKAKINMKNINFHNVLYIYILIEIILEFMKIIFL